MSYTLRDLIIDAIRFIIKHPKVITITMPITKRKSRTAYNSENSPLDFDTDLRSQICTLDASYLAYSDNDLQAMIDENLEEDETFGAEPPSGGN